MPSQAMSCTPVSHSDPGLPEEITDFQVDSNRPFVDPNNLYSLDSHGNAHYNAPEDPTQQQSEQGFDMAGYMSDLMSANPVIEQAFAWGEKNLPDEYIDQFNQIAASGDLDQLHNGIEYITAQFNEHGQVEQFTEEQQDQSDAEDFSDEQVAEIEAQFPIQELQNYMRDNYDQDTLDMFDQIVHNGSFDQVQQIYSTLYQEYLES